MFRVCPSLHKVGCQFLQHYTKNIKSYHTYVHSQYNQNRPITNFYRSNPLVECEPVLKNDKKPYSNSIHDSINDLQKNQEIMERKITKQNMYLVLISKFSFLTLFVSFFAYHYPDKDGHDDHVFPSM